jgi:hypothetical protein
MILPEDKARNQATDDPGEEKNLATLTKRIISNPKVADSPFHLTRVRS